MRILQSGELDAGARLRWLARLTGLAFLVGGCKPDAARTAEEAPGATTAVAVNASAVAMRDVSRRVTATGTVMPWQELTIGAEAAGLAVLDVRVGENDAVRPGEVLVRLDDRGLKAQVAQQKAAVSEAQASLQSARQEAARGEALVLQKAMSQESVDTRRTAILTNEAKLAQAAAALDQLQVQLDQTLIRAPTAGVVSADPIRLGTVTQIGTELVRLIRDGRLEAQIKVPERDLAGIRPAQAVRLTGPDGSVVDGRVRDVAAKLDAATRLGTIYVTLPAGAGLRGGMFVTAQMAVGDVRTPVIAEQALVWPDGKPSVFVVGADGAAGVWTIDLGDRVGREVVVADGLSAGERVVTAGAGFLHDGDAVQVRDAVVLSTVVKP